MTVSTDQAVYSEAKFTFKVKSFNWKSDAEKYAKQVNGMWTFNSTDNKYYVLPKDITQYVSMEDQCLN